MTLDEQMIQAAQSSIVKLLASGDWLKIDWSTKVCIGQERLRAVYDAVDMGRVNQLLQEKLEQRIADTIFNALATEIATDVKKIMSNTELREDCRATIRAKIREASKAIEKAEDPDG